MPFRWSLSYTCRNDRLYPQELAAEEIGEGARPVAAAGSTLLRIIRKNPREAQVRHRRKRAAFPIAVA